MISRRASESRARRFMRRLLRERLSLRLFGPPPLRFPLREFAYLDETSVQSLLASVTGEIVSEVRESASVASETGFGGRLRGGDASSGAAIEAKYRSSSSQSSEVLRKAVIQSTFKRLIEAVTVSNALHSIGGELSGNEGAVKSTAELATNLDRLDRAQLLLRADELKRGDLLELEVELNTEDIFKVSVALSAISEIVDKSPELFDSSPDAALRQMVSANRLLESILVGLVPITARIVDSKMLDLDGSIVVVREGVLGLSESSDLNPVDVHLVGVTEQELYWVDLRRVLFSGSRFTVFCRVSQDGVQDRWTPMKLENVLSSLSPMLAESIHELGTMAAEAIADGDSSSDAPSEREVFVRYAALVAASADVSLDGPTLGNVLAVVASAGSDVGSTTRRRELFEEVAQIVLSSSGRSIDPEVNANLRAEAAELNHSADNVATAVGITASGPPRFIEAEIVAIYW